MAHTRIKICGITRPEDALLAAELGADAIGLNFVQGPRKITFAQAGEILKAMPPLVTRIGLFSANGWKNTVRDAQFQQIAPSIDVTQWYGDYFRLEPQQTTANLSALNGPPWWIVIPIRDRQSITTLGNHLGHLSFHPQALVLDTASASALGGTGKIFDWRWISAARSAGELQGLPPLILAGGLNTQNVADAIRIARPFAVDVSSGVEVPGKPGVKDPVKMRDFIQTVRATD